MSLPALPIHYDSTLGAGFVACLISTALYGVTCAQSLSFYQNYPHERKIVKWAVAILWVLDTAHVMLVAHALYWFLVSHFTDPLIIIYIPWTIWASGIVAPTSDAIVRCFFIYRIWVLSQKKRWIAYPLCVLTLAVWADAIALAVKGFASLTFSHLQRLSWMLYLGLGLMTAGDFCFAASLCYYLRRGKSGANKQTNSMVNILMIYAINTGLITSVFSLASLITFVALPNTYIFLTMYFPLSKLYANALLATLNARDWLRAGIDNANVPLAIVNGQPAIPVAFSSGPAPSKDITIHVETEVIKSISGSETGSIGVIDISCDDDDVSTRGGASEKGTMV